MEASIEQAEAERMKALALDDEHAPEPRTTPAQALNMPSAEPPAAAAAAAVAAAQAAGVYGDEIMPPVPESSIEALRARLRNLEVEGVDDDDVAPTARGGGEAAGAPAPAAEDEEAAFLTRKLAFEEAFGTPFKKKQAFAEEDEEDEEGAVGEAARTRGGAEGVGGRELLGLPKKRFQPNPLYEDDEADEDDDDEDDEEEDEEDEAEAEAAARAEQEAGGDDALAALAAAVSLERLLGFSTHAHDHVLWHPEQGRLVYASGDTLMLHYYAAPGGPRQQPLRAGGGEISTLAGSDDRALVAVGAGGDAPIAVWDLSGAAPRLGVRLPGHKGGVQALAFSHSQAVGGCDLLASLGLADGSLRLSQLSTAQPLLHAALARPQHVVSWSHDNLELATGGAGGLYGWRVGWDEVDEADGAVTNGGGGVVTLAYLEPQPARVPWSADGDGGGTRAPHAQLTVVVHLAALHGDAPCILTGDTEGCLALWGEGDAPLAVWSCAHAVQAADPPRSLGSFRRPPTFASTSAHFLPATRVLSTPGYPCTQHACHLRRRRSTCCTPPPSTTRRPWAGAAPSGWSSSRAPAPRARCSASSSRCRPTARARPRSRRSRAPRSTARRSAWRGRTARRRASSAPTRATSGTCTGRARSPPRRS